MLRWYLIYTKRCSEAIAQANLERQNYEVYFQRVLQSIRCNGQRRERVTALFPRYLFLHLDEGRQSLAPVHSTVGVDHVVRFGSRYTTVPDEIVRNLRARADPETGLCHLASASFVPGAVVRVTAGPFDGLEGVFQRAAGRDRVVVLLELLGRCTPVRLPTDLIVQCDS